MNIANMFNLIKPFINLIRYFISPENYAKSIGVKLGKDSKIETRYLGSEPFLIEIGDHVHITSGVHFMTDDGGVWVFRQEEPDFDVFGKIKIGSNTFIGNGTAILPGVSIGKNCVIGAYSVVTKSIPDNTVAAGCPCRIISSTEEYKQRMIKVNVKTKLMVRRQKIEYLLSVDGNMLLHKKYLTKS